MPDDRVARPGGGSGPRDAEVIALVRAEAQVRDALAVVAAGQLWRFTAPSIEAWAAGVVGAALSTGHPGPVEGSEPRDQPDRAKGSAGPGQGITADGPGGQR